jgi:hypothetical protein
VPNGAPEPIKSVIDRVPHRDKEQEQIIGTSMRRLIAFIARDKEDLTNADIARITGEALEDGVNPDALVSSTTAAFDALRKGLRIVSENLTNRSKNPREALDYIATMLTRDRMDEIINDVGDTFTFGEKATPMTAGTVHHQLARMVRGESVDPALKPHLESILADAQHVISGLGKTAEAKRVTGPTVATQGKPMVVAFSDGSLHPLFAKGAVEALLANLPKKITEGLMRAIGLKPDEIGSLADHIGFIVGGDRKRVITTVDEMMAGVSKDERIARLDAEIAKSVSSGDVAAVSRLLAEREATVKVTDPESILVIHEKEQLRGRVSRLEGEIKYEQGVADAAQKGGRHEVVAERTGYISELRAKIDEAKAQLDALNAAPETPIRDGVVPVLVNTKNVLDPALITEEQAAALMKEAKTSRPIAEGRSTGNEGFHTDLDKAASPMAVWQLIRDGFKPKEIDGILKYAGFSGIREGDIARMFSVQGTKNMGEEIARVSALKGNATIPDAPLTGEIALNLTFEQGQHVDPLAVEQRAEQAGAPYGVAKIMGNFFKKNRPEDGLNGEQQAKVASFHGMQLMDNAARILRAGGKWLSNLMRPVEGTGFQEAFLTKMMSDLGPVVSNLDKMTGVDTWYKKVGSEIWRNLDMRSHAMPQSEIEQNMAMAMRSGDLSKLSFEEKQYVAQLQNHFKKLLKMQNDAGIPVGDITDGTNPNYLPQRMNVAWISANRDEAVKLLTEYFRKDRAGKFSLNTAGEDARKVINDVINKEELQGIIDSSNSTYAQAFGDKLHARQFRIVGSDWDKMHPMFDNNLRSLVTSYTEAAHKRVEWSKRFGIRGHGASTYVDIADRGAEAAINALQTGASGMKKTARGMSEATNDLVTDSEVREIEFMSKLFSPAESDNMAATKLIAEVSDRIDATKKDGGSLNGIVDMMVNKFIADGGFGADHYRIRAQAIVNGLADFGEEGRRVAGAEMDFMLKMVGTLGGRPAYTIAANEGLRTTAAALKMFNSVTLLSGAALGSLADPAMSLMRSGSIKAWLGGTAKAVKGALSDPAFAEAMMRVAVQSESILSENLVHVNGGATGRITNAFFQATMLTPWTNSMRQHAAVVAFESIKANQAIAKREIFNGTTDSWAYRRSIRYLRQLGLAELKDMDHLDIFSDAVLGDLPINMKIAEGIHRFVNESVFQPNRIDMPLWTQDPIASIFWQFKSYPTMMGRLVKRNFKEALAMENGKYAGDPMGLMYLLTIGAGIGAGAVAIKETVLGKNQKAEDGNWRSPRSQTLSKMVQEFGFKDYELGSPGADAVLGTYINGLLSIGALGFVGDLMYQSAKSVDNGAFGRERIMSQIAGPTLGTFSDTIQILEGASNAVTGEAGDGNEKQRNAVRKIVKRIPFVGNQDPWTEAFIDNTAGASTKGVTVDAGGAVQSTGDWLGISQTPPPAGAM